MLLILSCGGNSEDNIMPTPIPTPTPTPTPEPDGYSDTVKNLFFELCLPAANDQFCECSVNQIEENIPVDEFPVEDLMGRILSGEISEETSNSDIANLFPESVLEAVSPCFDLIIENKLSLKEIKRINPNHDYIDSLYQKIRNNEFKRYQSAPILKITDKSFGVGRRYPIVNNFKG